MVFARRDSSFVSDTYGCDEALPARSATPPAVTPARIEIAFVDATIADHETLIAGIRPEIEVVPVRGPGELGQIAARLGERPAVDAIHLFSHGAEGEVRFGSDRLDGALLAADTRGDLAQLASGLRPGGELLLYGCNVGKGVRGAAFVADLAARTGAAVAAATSFVGASARGGTWELARTTAPLATAPLRIEAFAGLLDLDSVMTNPTLTVTLDRPQDPDSSYFAIGVAGLPGANVAVLWGGQGGTHVGKVEFLSATGAVTATTAFTDAQFEGADAFMTPLANGNVMVTYDGYDGNAYFTIVSPSGVVADAVQVATVADIFPAIQLASGNIAVPVFLPQTGANGEAIVRIYNSQGTLVSSQAFTIDGASPVSISVNAAGNFLVGYQRSSDGADFAAIYPANSTTPSATLALGSVGALQTVALSNGNFAILTSDRTGANFSLEIVSSAGAILGNAVSLPGISDAVMSADLTSGQQGIVILSDDQEQGNVYAVRFDNAGNITAGGTQSTQGVNVTLENNGNGVEVHADTDTYLQTAASGYSNGVIGLYPNYSGTAPVVQTFELPAPTPPTISSIVRGSTAANPNNASSDVFTVTFSEAVTGVDASDFATTVTGNVTDTSISVTAVSSSVYTVTVGGVAGDGTLRLDLNSSGTGIASFGTAISSGYTSGQLYAIDHTAPSVSSITTSGAATNNATTEQFTVTFSEAVTGLDASDFTLTTTGSLAATSASASGSGTTYTVMVGGLTGDGTLRLDLNGSGTGIADAAGNGASGYTGGGVYTVQHSLPTIGSAGNTTATTAGTTAVTIASALTVSDAVSSTLSSATVSVGSGFQAGDVLSATVAGTSVTESYNAATGVLTLSGSDTLADYQQVLRSITFAAAGATAATYPETDRTIAISLNDGVNTSTVATETVTVATGVFADTAANVSLDFDALNADMGLTGITITDNASISISQAQAQADTRALGFLGGTAHDVEVSGLSGYPYTATTSTYDASGHVTAIHETGFTTTGYAELDFTFDANGRKTSLTELDGQGNNILGATFAYDGNGGYTETVTPSAAGSYATLVETFDSAGHMLSKGYTGLTGKTYTGSTTSYDTSGHVTEVKQTGFTGAYAELDYAYDSSGRKTGLTELDGQGGTILDASFTYPNGGGYTETVTPSAVGSYASLVESVDASGHLVSRGYAGLTGQAYTASTTTYDTSGTATGIVETGFTGTGYAELDLSLDSTGRKTSLIERDGQGGTLLQASFAYGTNGYTETVTPPVGAGYTTLVEQLDAAGHMLSKGYTGVAGRAYTNTTTTYDTAGTITDLDQSGFTGTGYGSVHVDYVSGVQAVQTLNNNDGTHTVTALALGVSVADTSASETFKLTAGDTFTLTSSLFGMDVIQGYTPGNAQFDIAHTVFGSFTDLMNHAASDGHGGTIITLDAQDSIKLSGVTTTQLTAHQGDFHFV